MTYRYWVADTINNEAELVNASELDAEITRLIATGLTRKDISITVEDGEVD
jgi:hypothetical protein